MVLKYIENLRSKSKDARKTYAFFFSFLITGFVVLIWVIGLFLGSYGMRAPESERYKKDTENTNASKTVEEMFNSSNSFLDTESVSSEGEKQNDWTQDLQRLEYQQNKAQQLLNSSTTQASTTVGTSSATTTLKQN